MKAKCSVCGKDAKIVKGNHWKTGMEVELIEGTCGHPECLKNYEESMEESYRMVKESYDFEVLTQELSNVKA